MEIQTRCLRPRGPRRAWISALIIATLLALGLLPTPLAAATPSTPTPNAATGQDATVPREPPQTIQQAGGAVRTQSIRRTRTADGREAVADRVIVAFRPGVSDAEQNSVHQAVTRSQPGVTPTALKQIGTSASYVDITGAPSLETAIKAYQADPRVAYAEPDFITHTTETPNDPSFSQQYGMTKIQAPAAWDATHGSPTVKIAILDCGIYEAHPDLTGKVVARQDFTGSPYGTDDQCNHGTHVAAIASANTNDGTGVAGVGYTTSLLNGKALIETYNSAGQLTGGSGTTTWAAAGIRWAADHGANVINMSFGGPGACSQIYQAAIDYAWSKNVVIVAAAGNDGANESFQPADCAHVIAVASTDRSDVRSNFSNYGAWVALAAPGSLIYSSVNPNIAENGGQAYAYFNGTSMASPHVAGLAGLIWATHWATNAQAVVTRLETTADHITGTGTTWQYGRINAQAAVGGAPPVATSLSPATVAPGSPPFTLTVTGSNFQPGATVRWNGVSRTTTFVSATQLTAAILANDVASVGTANITVANSDGAVSVPALMFTIAAGPPHPTTLTPAVGNIGGGAAVTIAGTGFRSGVKVSFGGVSATISSITSVAIVAVAPAHAAGLVTITVTNLDGQSGSIADGFQYSLEPNNRGGPSATGGPPATAPTARQTTTEPNPSTDIPPAPAPPHR